MMTRSTWSSMLPNVSRKNTIAAERSKKMEEVSERRNKNRAQAMEQLESQGPAPTPHLPGLRGAHDWIQERNVLVQEDTYRSARTAPQQVDSHTRHLPPRSRVTRNRLDKILRVRVRLC